MAEIIKINNTTVAKVGTEEVRQIYSSTQLAARKTQLEASLVEVNELIAALK